MRLIDADALLAMGRARKIIEVVGNWYELPGCAKSALVRLGCTYKKMILEAPTVDAKPVVHGRCDWCKQGDERCGTCKNFFTDDGSRCSAEHDDIRCAYYEPMNYCPNCGADMRGHAE